MSSRRGSGEGNNMMPLFVLLGIAVLGVAGFFIYKVGFSQYTVNPPKIFQDVFDERLESITDLTGGGNISGNFDYWIHFKLPGRTAALKKKAEFQEVPADKEMARRWFAEAESPSSPSLDVKQFNNLKFFKRVENETQSVSCEWLLHNWRTDDQFYRRWGY